MFEESRFLDLNPQWPTCTGRAIKVQLHRDAPSKDTCRGEKLRRLRASAKGGAVGGAGKTSHISSWSFRRVPCILCQVGVFGPPT